MFRTAITGLLFLSFASVSFASVIYPTSTPAGEIPGGTFQMYFDNMYLLTGSIDVSPSYTEGCPLGMAVRGFDAAGRLKCISPAATTFTLTGSQNGDTVRYNGSEWIRTNFLYNDGTAVGINTQTPGATLDVNGQVRIQGGLPGINKVLISDATGLATWGNTPNPCIPGGTGPGNTCYGTGALQNNTTGQENVAIGVSALGANTVGEWNVANGVNAMFSNTSGRSNVGIGTSALRSNTSGTWNTALGDNALFGNATGWYNTALGAYALSSSAGDNNTAIGSNAGLNLVSGNSNIAIGANTNFPSTSASNQLNIGNWIYGSGGWIGIGSTNPARTLDVSGDTVTNALYTRDDGGWINQTHNGGLYMSDAAWIRTYNDVGIWTNYGILGTQKGLSAGYWGAPPSSTGGAIILGDVGIGTPTPTAKLEVNGQVKITGGSPGAGKVLVSDGVGLASWGNPPPSSTAYATGIIASAASGNYITKFMAGGSGITSSIMYENGGKIAIGTTSPTYMFDVQGSGSIIRAGSGFCLGMTASGCVTDWTDLNNVVKSMGTPNYLAKFNSGGLIDNSSIYETGGNLYIGDISSILGGGATIGYITIEAGGSTNSSRPFLTLSENGGQECRLWINGSNKLGSNCTWTAGATGFGFQPYQMPVADSAGDTLTGSTVYNVGNNVGIGTNTPSENLTVSGSMLVTNQITIAGGSPGAGKILTSDSSGLATWTNVFSGSMSSSGIVGGAGTQNYVTKFGAGGNGLVISQIFDTGTGVAIGSTTPGSKFEIWNGLTSIFHMRGTNNVGLGLATVRYQTSGSANVGFGNSTLRTLTTGYSNSALGDSTLYNNTSGYFNSALGSQALYSNSMGNWNVGIGSQALWTSTSGNYNIAMGGQSLYSLSSGNDNIGIGYQALRANLGSNNIGIGSNAGSTITSGGNNILIGSNAAVPSNTASNQLSIGNWIYATNGNVGIGTGTNLTARLTVDSGTNNVAGLRLPRINNSSTAYTGAAIGLGVDANGNVVPVSNGDVVVYDALNRATPPTPDPNIASRTISYDFNNYFDIPTKQSFVVSTGDSSSFNGPFIRSNGTSPVCSWNGTFGTSPYNCQTDTDEFGVSASPWNSFTMTAKGDTFGYQLALGARGDAPLFARSGRFNGAEGGGLYTNDSPFQTPAPWQKVLTIPANHTEYFYINTGYNSQLQAQANGGRIGIGTTSPNYGLDIRSEVGMMNRVYLTGTTASAGTPTLSFAGDTNMGIFRPAADTLSVSTAGTERMRIFSNGNVSIGSTTNSAKLRVEGQVMITGGTPGAGKVLTSDASGLATWQTPSGGGGGGGTTILQATVYDDIPSVSNNSCTTRTYSVPGAVTGKTAWLSPASAFSNGFFITYTRVSASDTVEAKFCNESGGSINTPGMNYYVSVIQ